MELEGWKAVVDALDFSTLKKLKVTTSDKVPTRMVTYRILVDGILSNSSCGRVVSVESLIIQDFWGDSTIDTQRYIRSEMAKVPRCIVSLLTKSNKLLQT